MSDPIRLAKLLDTDARRVLTSVREDAPPPASKDALLASLGLTAAGSAAPAALGGGAKAAKAAAASSWWSAPLGKTAVLIAVGTSAAVGGVAARGAFEGAHFASNAPPSASSVASTPPKRAQPSSAERGDAPASEPVAPDIAPVVRTAIAPRPAANPAPSRIGARSATSGAAAMPEQSGERELATSSSADRPSATVSVLRDELALLDDARARLREDDATGALERLDVHDRLFSNGPLAQEASAMRVDALLGVGRAAEATEIARTFLASHPNSTQAPRVRRALERLSIR